MGEPLEFSAPIDDSKVSDAVRSRPGKLTAVAIIAIVLGGFGVLGAVQMTFALSFGKRFQQMQQDSMGGGQAHIQQAIEEMNSSISDVTDRFFVVCVVVAVVGASLSVGLIYSATRT